MAAQTVGIGNGWTSPGVTNGKLTLFLTDPDLGVVGSYSNGHDTIYFDARSAQTKNGASSLSVRLLDANGRTIATAGHSMDAKWHKAEYFDAHSVAASQKLARSLGNELNIALSDPVFNAERSALISLSDDMASADLSRKVLVENLPNSVSASTPASARDDYYRRTLGDLHVSLDKQGDFDATFRGTHMQAAQLSFPGEQNEEGKLGRIETYARLLSPDGQALAEELGGDSAPSQWTSGSDTAATFASDDVSTHLQKLGGAALAAHTLAKTRSQGGGLLSAHEIRSFEHMASELRDNLIPQTDEAKDAAERDRLAHGGAHPMAGGTWSPTYNKSTNFQEYTHPVAAPVGEHSGTYVRRYTWSSPSSYTLQGYQGFGNHGSYPYNSDMTYRCQFSGNFHSVWAYAPQRNTLTGNSSDHTWHSCNTGYLISSTYGHNCNDDAWTQLMWTNFRGSEASPDHNKCNDVWPDDNGPHCTDAGSAR